MCGTFSTKKTLIIIEVITGLMLVAGCTLLGFGITSNCHYNCHYNDSHENCSYGGQCIYFKVMCFVMGGLLIGVSVPALMVLSLLAGKLNEAPVHPAPIAVAQPYATQTIVEQPYATQTIVEQPYATQTIVGQPYATQTIVGQPYATPTIAAQPYAMPSHAVVMPQTALLYNQANPDYPQQNFPAAATTSASSSHNPQLPSATSPGHQQDAHYPQKPHPQTATTTDLPPTSPP